MPQKILTNHNISSLIERGEKIKKQPGAGYDVLRTQPIAETSSLLGHVIK